MIDFLCGCQPIPRRCTTDHAARPLTAATASWCKRGVKRLKKGPTSRKLRNHCGSGHPQLVRHGLSRMEERPARRRTPRRAADPPTDTDTVRYLYLYPPSRRANPLNWEHPFSLFGRRSTDDSRAHRTITSLAVTLILTLFASLDSSWYDSTSTPRWSSFQAGQLSEPSAPAQHPHQHQRQVDQQQRCEFQTTHATRCNVKLVTAAQQLHGILDNTANNKVLECELRLYALQTILGLRQHHARLAARRPAAQPRYRRVPRPGHDILYHIEPSQFKCKHHRHTRRRS